MTPQADLCSKAFESILYQSGKFGSYQRRLFAITSAMHVITFSILGYLKFIPHVGLRHVCVEALRPDMNFSVVFITDNDTAEYEVTCTSSYVNDIGLEDDWVFPDWVYPGAESPLQDLAYYCQAAGLGLGLLTASLLSDYLGRRRVMFACYILMCAARTSSAFSPDIIFFLACQAVVGIGASGCLVSSMTLLLEYVGHDWRDICLCLLPWWLGPGLLALQAHLLRHWRYLAFTSGLLGLPLAAGFFLVLESARWLLCNQQFSEAEQTTRELVACNCSAVHDLTSLFDVSRACVLNFMHKRKFTFLDLIQPKLRKVTVAVIFTWFLGSLVYFCLHHRVRNVMDSPYVNDVMVYCVDVIVILSAVLINKCLGRRWCLFLYSMSSGFISMCILVLHITNESDIEPGMITALAFFTKLGVTTSLLFINLITLETYPTVVRTMGAALGHLSGLAGYILADTAASHLEPYHYTVPFIAYGAVMCVMALFVLLFPETHRQPLPDIIRCRHRNLCYHETVRLNSGWSE